MIRGKVVLPEDLELEQDSLYNEFFSQYGLYDEIEDGAWEEFFKEHASRRLKKEVRQIQRQIASAPAGVHI